MEKLNQAAITPSHPICLFDEGEHRVYWLGITENTAFRCNVYLIKDHDEAIIVDPGSRTYFEQVKTSVKKIINPEQIRAMILCHQDPDVAASMVDWLALNSKMQVITSPRAHVLLPHFGVVNYSFYDIEAHPEFSFASGRKLRFISAPHLHSAAAFSTYDETAQFLFSGDIWAALSTSWQLVVQDFETHALNMDMFHMDYMASNIAARGFVRKLDDLTLTAILPQHGSILSKQHVPLALKYLRHLQCGTDIEYPDLTLLDDTCP